MLDSYSSTMEQMGIVDITILIMVRGMGKLHVHGGAPAVHAKETRTEIIGTCGLYTWDLELFYES